MNNFFSLHQNPLPYSSQVVTSTDLSCFLWVRNVFLSFTKLLLSPSPYYCVRGKKKKKKPPAKETNNHPIYFNCLDQLK